MEPPRLEMFLPGKASSDVHGSIALSCSNDPFKNTHPSPIRINTPYLHFPTTPPMCLHSHLHPTASTQPGTGHGTPPFHVPTPHSKTPTPPPSASTRHTYTFVQPPKCAHIHICIPPHPPNPAQATVPRPFMSQHPIQKHPPLLHPHQHAIPTLSCDPPYVLAFTFASHCTHPTPHRPPYLALSCPNTPFKNTHPSPIRINTPYLHFPTTPPMCSHSHLHPTASTQPGTGHGTPPFHVPTPHSKTPTPPPSASTRHTYTFVQPPKCAHIHICIPPHPPNPTQATVPRPFMSQHPIQKHPPLPHPPQHGIPTLSCNPPNVLGFTFASHRIHPTRHRPRYPAVSCSNTPFKNTHPSPIRINTPYLHFLATLPMCSHSHLHPIASTQPGTGHGTPPFHVPTPIQKHPPLPHPPQHGIPTLS